MYITRVFRVLGFGRRRQVSAADAAAAAATVTAVIGKDARRVRKKQCVCEYAIICENTILLFGKRNLYSSST